MRTQAEYKHNELRRLRTQLCAYGPQSRIEALRQSLDMSCCALTSAVLRNQEKSRAKLSALAGKLDALSPLRILSGGYAAVEYDSAFVGIGNIPPVGGDITVTTSDLKIKAMVRELQYIGNGGESDG